MQLGRAAGDVEGRDEGVRQDPQAGLDNIREHRLGAVGTRVHVAVAAGLVALPADVDLEDDPGGDQREQPRAVEGGLETPRGRQLTKAPPPRDAARERMTLLLQRG
jgi:hypothetical protein